MLSVLGWIWVALGVWWFFRPQGIRNRFERGMGKRLRALLVVVLLAVAGVLFTAGRELGGVACWIVPAVGVFVCLKGLLVLRGKVSDVVLSWLGDRSDLFYRGSALVLIGLGLGLEWLTTRRGEG